MHITEKQLRKIIRETSTQSEAEERQELYSLINDLEKEAYDFRMHRDLSSWTTQELRGEVGYLTDRIRSDAESKERKRLARAELEASEAEITSLMPTAEEMELERMPVGKAARRHEGKKMRISKNRLAKIIKEEVSRVISEMEIVNADSGEILTVDELPAKYAGRLTKDESGYDALYDPDFESLRRDLELDPDEALSMLEDMASEMMGEAQGDLGTAIDLAQGIQYSDTKVWNAALRSQRIKDFYYEAPDYGDDFDTISDALARWLAERIG